MDKINYLAFCCWVFFLSVSLTSCSPSTPTPPSISANQNSKQISYTETDIKNMANCWLSGNNTGFDKWVGDRQCTALARLLTTAPGYGKDTNGVGLGGSDYIKKLKNMGVIIPKLADVKNQVKPCDNLVLVGPEYDTAGHTVIVFYPDLENDTIYYIDQNYSDQGIRLRQLNISINDDNTYVIAAECARPIDINCFSVADIPEITPTTIQPAVIGSIQVSPADGIENDSSVVGTWEGSYDLEWFDQNGKSMLRKDDIPIKLEILENHTVKMISENVINTDFSWQLTNETITIKEIEEECRGFTMTGIVGNNKITGQMETTGEKSKSDGICPLHGTWQVVKKN